jgi:hypothetical protein
MATLEAFLVPYVSSITREEILRWPPDAFAISAVILKTTGAYTKVVNNWPPDNGDATIDWQSFIKGVGEQWREAIEAGNPLPTTVVEWWSEITSNAKLPLEEISQNDVLCGALLQLLAAADEACFAIGIPDPTDSSNVSRKGFVWKAKALLQKQSREGKPSTLCKNIPASMVAVLPKLHTPTMGATLRSLTHNLALHCSPEVSVHWYQIETQLDHTVNVLCLPWPLELRPTDFTKSTTNRMGIRNAPRHMGFFDYSPPQISEFAAELGNTFDLATRCVGEIDGVVFPELSMSEQTFEIARDVLTEKRPTCFLIAGVQSDGANEAFCSIPHVGEWDTMQPLEVRKKQAKHHRWKLDRSQIAQYGLGGRLDISNRWWEGVVVQQRVMHFFSMQSWLTMGVLICEDLARQEPVADLIRAVGPNLVIALLMDGPQLAGRWPARYATVLADDPGCSVLTLSSLGMVQLSKPFDKPASRVVGLWKDYKSPAAIEIELPPGKKGVVLSLTRQMEKEYTADGRDDDTTTAYLMLTALHTV